MSRHRCFKSTYLPFLFAATTTRFEELQPIQPVAVDEMILADINADAEQTTTMKDDSQEMTTADDAPLTMTSQIDVDLLLDDVTTSSGTYTSSSTKSG